MSWKDLKHKIKFKTLNFDEETGSYIQMLLITYLITIAMVAVCLFLLFDNNKSSEFQFSRCEKVDGLLYGLSFILQTLVPTTITFSGTIIILQSNLSERKLIKTLLFITIILLALCGVLQTSAQSTELLYGANFSLIILNTLALFFSRKVFYLPSENVKNSKREESDCKPIS